MKTYAAIINPGYNSVYFEKSKSLAAAETEILGSSVAGGVKNVRVADIANVPYVVFDSESELSGEDLNIIRSLSFFYALYELRGGALLPVDTPETGFLDRGVGAMLKYTGKTNAIFTRMAINIAVHVTGLYKKRPRLNILDPVAGKGTALFEALSCGYDAYGIEIDAKCADEAYQFFKKYLETAKYKHETSIQKITQKISGQRENKAFTALRHNFTFAANKDDYKNKKTAVFEIIAGDSAYADAYYKKRFFDAVIGDLPYGVRHGGVAGGKRERSPKELLANCLPAWRSVLATDGVLALSWNLFLLTRNEMISILNENSFSAIDLPYDFEHRVDQAIKRDIIFAKNR